MKKHTHILYLLLLLLVGLAPGFAQASEAIKPVAGQRVISLHAARNMAAASHIAPVDTKARFLPLRRDSGGLPLKFVSAAGKPTKEIQPQPTAVRDSLSSDISYKEAKLILSIFGASD